MFGASSRTELLFRNLQNAYTLNLKYFIGITFTFMFGTKIVSLLLLIIGGNMCVLEQNLQILFLSLKL